MARKMPIRMSVTEKAEALVSRLLEDDQHVRVCAHCEKEFGPDPRVAERTKSHGICRRHAIEHYGDMPEFLEKIKHKPDDYFSPDMAQQRQAA